jgi:hypothetical protein
MADTETEATEETQQSENGSSGSENGGHKTALAAAALAAATGATAYAAKRMWSERQESQSEGEGSQKPKPKSKSSGSGDDESLVGSMFTSGWEAARDSLLPVAEEAATTAGEFVARSAPEVVRDRLVPRFIAGFERGRESGGD